MRSIVSKNDREMILSLYDKGRSMTDIAEILDYPHYTVKAIIKEYTGHYTEIKIVKPVNWNGHTPEDIESLKQMKKIKEIDPNRIINLYKLGHSIDEIVFSERNVTVSEVKDILYKAKLLKLSQVDKDIIEISRKEEEKAVTVENINKFKSTVKIGDRFRIRKDKYDGLNSYIKIRVTVTVQQLYPNFVKTDKGSFQYFDLFVGDKLN